MVHGILQFTPSIAFRYVLHRCESRDIRCRESFATFRRRRSARPSAPRTGLGGGRRFASVFLGASRAGVRWPARRELPRAGGRGGGGGGEARRPATRRRRQGSRYALPGST